MASLFHAGSVRALAFGLILFSISPAFAQTTAVKTKNGKVKTKTSGSETPILASPEPAPVARYVPGPPELGPSSAAKAETPSVWLSDFDEALTRAKAANRPILVVFSGSDWCKPCIMYEKEVFSQPEFMAYAKDRLVLAHFDFPRLKKNQPTAAQVKLNELAAAQLNKAGDFPLAVLVSAEGKVLAKTGYIPGGPAAFEAYLKTVVPML